MAGVLSFPVLRQISLPAEERRNITKLYNKMTLGEVSKLAPGIPWVDYVNNLLRAAGHQVRTVPTGCRGYDPSPGEAGGS